MIVVDNFHEIELLKTLLTERNVMQKVMVRITPGITAHTNEYIQTGQVDSKFGFDLASGQADQAIQALLADSHFKVMGLHAHIGSQIFDVQGFAGVAQKLVEVAKHWQTKFDYVPTIVNVGAALEFGTSVLIIPKLPNNLWPQLSARSKRRPRPLTCQCRRFGLNLGGH